MWHTFFYLFFIVPILLNHQNFWDKLFRLITFNLSSINWNFEPQIISWYWTLKDTPTCKETRYHWNKILSIHQFQRKISIMKFFSSGTIKSKYIASAIFKFDLINAFQFLTFCPDDSKIFEKQRSKSIKPLTWKSFVSVSS